MENQLHEDACIAEPSDGDDCSQSHNAPESDVTNTTANDSEASNSTNFKELAMHHEINDISTNQSGAPRLNPLKAFLLRISNDITSDEFKSMKFLITDNMSDKTTNNDAVRIPRGVVQNLHSATDLLATLHDRIPDDEEYLVFLIDIFKNIKNIKIANKVEAFRNESIRPSNLNLLSITGMSLDDQAEGTMEGRGKKNIFIVFAHPTGRGSLNHAILDITRDELTSQGHTVTVSDLYEMKFNPILTGKESVSTWVEDEVADDIRQEQKKLDAADLVIFQFPLYWMGFPAILKGWFDRVYQQGYALDIPTKVLDQATFKGKRAMLSLTTGGDPSSFSNHGIMGDIDLTLWPIQGAVLQYMGYDVLPPHIIYGSLPVQEAFAKWRHRLHSIFNDEPLFTYKLSDFEYGTRLNKEVLDGLKGCYGPSTGQHCGKILPPGGQTTTRRIDGLDKTN